MEVFMSINPLNPISNPSPTDPNSGAKQKETTYIHPKTGLIAPFINEKFRAARVKDREPPLLPDKKA